MSGLPVVHYMHGDGVLRPCHPGGGGSMGYALPVGTIQHTKTILKRANPIVASPPKLSLWVDQHFLPNPGDHAQIIDLRWGFLLQLTDWGFGGDTVDDRRFYALESDHLTAPDMGPYLPLHRLNFPLRGHLDLYLWVPPLQEWVRMPGVAEDGTYGGDGIIWGVPTIRWRFPFVLDDAYPDGPPAALYGTWIPRSSVLDPGPSSFFETHLDARGQWHPTPPTDGEIPGA